MFHYLNHRPGVRKSALACRAEPDLGSWFIAEPGFNHAEAW